MEAVEGWASLESGQVSLQPEAVYVQIAGLYYLIRRKKNYSKMVYYHCSHCDYVFPLKMKNCPICEENGYKVKLTKYESPHEIGLKIPVVDFA